MHIPKNFLLGLAFLISIQAAQSQDLFKAMQSGDLAQVRQCLKADSASVNITDPAGRTPLHLAALEGQAAMISLFIQYGAALDATDARSMTPLFYAVYRGHVDAAKVMLDGGASTQGVIPPLVMAAGSGDLQMATLLLDADADINAMSMMGAPLHRAAFMGQIEMAKLLLARGADVQAGWRGGWTPLHVAAMRNNTDMAKLLLGHQAPIDKQDDEGYTPLHRAIQSTEGDVQAFAELMLTHHAIVQTLAADGTSPLLLAVKGGHARLCQMLIDKGADTAILEPQSNHNLLHLATLGGYGDIVRLLLDKGLAPAPAMLGDALQYSHSTVAAMLKKQVPGLKNDGRPLPSPVSSLHLKKGQARLWRMHNRGWSIKTANHLLVFDNEELGVEPDSPSLNNGWIEASEIKDDQVIALYTCYHAQPGTQEFIHALEDQLNHVTFVHYSGDAWRGCQSTVYLEGDTTRQVAGATLHSTELQSETGMGWLAHLIEVDGVTLYYSGFHIADIETYKIKLNHLAKQVDQCDIAILDIREPVSESMPHIQAAIKTLKPKTLLLCDTGRHRPIDSAEIQTVREAFPDIQIGQTTLPGDGFLYQNGKLVPALK